MFHVVEVKKEVTPRENGAFRFTVAASGSTKTPDQVLTSLFVGRPLALHVRSHWIAYPTLRDSCRRLLAIIGPEWRSNAGDPPLIVTSIERATSEAIRLVQEEAATGRLVVATYLRALVDEFAEVAAFITWGGSEGNRQRWAPLDTPWDVWAEGCGATEVEIEPGPPMTKDQIDGYRGHALTRIAAPAEAGYVLRKHF